MTQLKLIASLILISFAFLPTTEAKTADALNPQACVISPINQEKYPLYPAPISSKPDIPSPFITDDGIEIITALTIDGDYLLIPVTQANDERINPELKIKMGKGLQLEIDEKDFPTLARTGLHATHELDNAKTITGKPVEKITEIGRPDQSSGVGFMSKSENIISVLKGDNRLVKELGLTHPQMAKPLFHVWNLALQDIETGHFRRFWKHFQYVLYNQQKVIISGFGTKGWQESIFNDEIKGTYQFDIHRELNAKEISFLREKYAELSEPQFKVLTENLTRIHIGEMVPYYIMRYGFYEGHTGYRADPIALSCIFGLRSIEQIEAVFPHKLYQALTDHFTE